MSESEAILNKFQSQLQMQESSWGVFQKPVMCIAGSNDYDTLTLAIESVYGITKSAGKENGVPHFMGVDIFRTTQVQEGFMFGTKDR